MTDKAPDLSKAEKLARAMHNILSGGKAFDRQIAAQCRDELRALAARVDALTKANETWALNSRATFDAMVAMRDSINEHVPMPSLESDMLTGPENSVFCAAVAEAVIARVEALTKERDRWKESSNTMTEWYEHRGNLVEKVVVELNTALARLGAVQRETLDRAAAIVRRAGHSLDDEIASLPLDPDASAALERALQAEREACAGVVRGIVAYDRFGCPTSDETADAILARGQKDNAND